MASKRPGSILERELKLAKRTVSEDDAEPGEGSEVPVATVRESLKDSNFSLSSIVTASPPCVRTSVTAVGIARRFPSSSGAARSGDVCFRAVDLRGPC